MPQRIVTIAHEIGTITSREVDAITGITKQTKMLAINALIEAGHAGDHGKGFAVVANEIRSISDQITQHAGHLHQQLGPRLADLDRLGGELIADIYGQRLADLAHNLIEIIDRNLYERSCDVRWWATDSAVVDACQNPLPEVRQHASKRLAVILGAYTVYVDIWICAPDGQVVANGNGSRFPSVVGHSVADQSWFKEALAGADGDAYTVAPIQLVPVLDNRQVAIYATAVRAGGDKHGAPTGVIAVCFDWQTQAQTVVDGLKINDKDRQRTRCMIIDAKHNVLAASDRQGILTETFPLKHQGQTSGHYHDQHQVIGFALTPGYETYRGLGWYGVITQTRDVVSRPT